MNKTILLIEDNMEVRENTAEILELAGYHILTAANGKEGVDIAIKEKPALIICDIMMPILDGYGVLHLLSKNAATETIPFIFLTAKAERNDFRKGMEMGADDYITKPFDDIELLNAVESRLKKASLLQKEYAKNMEGLENFLEDSRGLATLDKIAEEREIRSYRKKDVIYKEGAYPRGVYFLNKGKVKTYKISDTGKELITGLYKEGDFFGYLSVLEEGQYTDAAAAMEESEICLLPREEFHGLIYKNADVARKFLQLLSNNLQEKEEQLVKLAYNSVRKKVADALVTLYNRYKQDEEVFTMSISREDLANLAGIATESTIRTLSDLKDEKLIDIHASKITILNYKKLVDIKN